mmetsp:Transcript_103117/g.183227  ORF Transcript_103117/g.183227 Transcript_103117/m.183227 type:complete len:205 (-) Transcript_103117:144-758(-)|eukprot:CAMPEP_0197646950 /NCGR_PEP_ID=MMETSP1338-20131121/23947_1 /TAXON_ID=43686 ORGANISM="Pelagodinium beii, Strain RCC1491" /NCGR_SAMPLE_ID=MMETSP1338 /ASSEMBLY_ACC=CAM_ASM_000754 /LENGTH=204 /DNA_ID=CAMNT_0043220639 /DNA_START=74 /DNA_END=688 /DNA_ORIENTATION=-
MALQTQEAQHGVSFRTDLSAVGSGRSSKLFTGGSSNILNEERRLIEKVFSIVDKDNSGSVDVDELKGMFRLFNVEAQFLETAINKIMSSVDKDMDYMISPQEFYTLLSQKFEDGDPESEMEDVYGRMDSKKDRKLDVDELFEVSNMLGENIPKSEIKDMIKMFNKEYQDKLKEYKKPNSKVKEPSDANLTLSLEDFKRVMKEKL